MLSVLKLKNNLDRLNMVDDKITQINNKLAVLRTYDNIDKNGMNLNFSGYHEKVQMLHNEFDASRRTNVSTL